METKKNNLISSISFKQCIWEHAFLNCLMKNPDYLRRNISNYYAHTWSAKDPFKCMHTFMHTNSNSCYTIGLKLNLADDFYSLRKWQKMHRHNTIVQWLLTVHDSLTITTARIILALRQELSRRWMMIMLLIKNKLCT